MSPNSTDCSFLLSIIGFSSTIGRILFGFISDFHQCNRIYIYAHCLTVCGLSTMMTMFAVNYSLLAVFCVLFGLTTGKPLFNRQCVGIVDLTISLGFHWLFIEIENLKSFYLKIKSFETSEIVEKPVIRPAPS